MRNKSVLLILPLLCLPSCSNQGGLISPNSEVKEFVLRNGDLFDSPGTDYPFLVESVDVSKVSSEATGETLLYYFSSEACSFCSEVKDGLYSFLEETDLKVIGLSPTTSISYNDAIARLKNSYPESAAAFFKSWGTPLLFSLKNGQFDKLEIYGNHKNKNAVAKLLSGKFSYPYIYEFTKESSLNHFLDQGYPVLLLDEDDGWGDFYDAAKLASKKSGLAIKSKFTSESQEDLSRKYGEGSRLILGERNLSLNEEKEGCISLLKSYFGN